jgi:hypothetical protein
MSMTEVAKVVLSQQAEPGGALAAYANEYGQARRWFVKKDD